MTKVSAIVFVTIAVCLSVRAEPPGLVDYQGRVMVGGEAYDGTGYFKFTISDAGNTNVWTHNGSSVGSTVAPTGCVTNTVNSGVFSLMLGDTAQGMLPLTADIFNSGIRYLRVWFATSAAGPFSEMLPAQRLAAVPYALSAGVTYIPEMGDLSMGTYTNRP